MNRTPLPIALRISSVLLLFLTGLIIIPSSQPVAALQPDEPISGITIRDGRNSTNAARLLDGELGTSDGQSWTNPRAWDASRYPMAAVVDLGGSYNVDRIEYRVGNLTIGTDRLLIEVSTEPTGYGPWRWAAAETGHTWDSWHSAELWPNNRRSSSAAAAVSEPPTPLQYL